MSHPKDNELIPIGTTVVITHGISKGKKAIITHQDFLKDGKNFLNYRGTIEGRKGYFALYHHEIEIQ